MEPRFEIFVKIFSSIYHAFFKLSATQRKAVIDFAKSKYELMVTRKGFGPEWEAVRLKCLPYVEFVAGVWHSFIGAGFFLLSAAGISVGIGRPIGWWLAVAIVVLLVSFEIVLRSLQSASWAYHEIRQRFK